MGVKGLMFDLGAILKIEIEADDKSLLGFKR